MIHYLCARSIVDKKNNKKKCRRSFSFFLVCAHFQQQFRTLFYYYALSRYYGGQPTKPALMYQKHQSFCEKNKKKICFYKII
jgi:hypothetical protein